MDKPRLITFDVYTGLFDIEGSLTPHVARAFSLAHEEARPLVQLWRTKQMARAAASNSLGLGRMSFRDATRLGLDYVIRRHGLEVSAGAREELAQVWDKLHPWPEAERVLAELKRVGLAIAILSNGDRDMLEAAARRFCVTFDHIFSAETAGYYKPHATVYELPTKVLGIARENVLHIAGSADDVLGAVAFGMPCAWSNRSGDVLVDPAYAPLHEFSDLTGLLAWL